VQAGFLYYHRVPPARVNVLGVGISVLNLDSAVAEIDQALREKRKGYVCVTGVHGVMEAQRDDGLRAVFNRSLLTTPDGMPMVWAGRWAGHDEMGRVYGPDLMLRLCELSVRKGYTHFLLGGKEGVAPELKLRLEERFLGLRIVGTYTPPFRALSPAEEADLVARVAACKPDLLWVGISTPKQDRFMAAYGPQLDATVLIGVGAAFDFHTGRLRQAPAFVQRAGLEWLFRLTCEPRRLWRRYLVNNPRFLLASALQASGLKRYTIDERPADLRGR
jgi:N-acetylglucosaminyldiphosphoundecaprenol N-acetyl-beta-D-mannosaminyltransferase